MLQSKWFDPSRSLLKALSSLMGSFLFLFSYDGRRIRSVSFIFPKVAVSNVFIKFFMVWFH